MQPLVLVPLAYEFANEESSTVLPRSLSFPFSSVLLFRLCAAAHAPLRMPPLSRRHSFRAPFRTLSPYRVVAIILRLSIRTRDMNVPIGFGGVRGNLQDTIPIRERWKNSLEHQGRIGRIVSRRAPLRLLLSKAETRY